VVLIALDAISGLAIVDRLGTAVHLNTGLGADMRLGLSLGF
jgi:hypothetical protein